MLTIGRGVALTLSGGSSVPVADPSFASTWRRLHFAGANHGDTCNRRRDLSSSRLLRFLGDRKKSAGGAKTKRLSAGFVIAPAGFALAFYVFGGGDGLPVPVAIFVVIAAAAIFVLGYTRFGRRLYAIGGNEEAARLSGIPIYQTKLIVYVIVSLLAALSGILLASRLNGASPNLGTMFELDAIAAVVIGGTSLAGGSGTIGGTIIGALIIGVLNNGMSLLGVSSFYQLIIKGLIISLAVWFDVLQKKR